MLTYDLPIPVHPGIFALQETRERKQPDMLLLTAVLTTETGAHIIDCGNYFNAYTVIKTVRLKTSNLSILNRLQVARAFNCHQVVSLAQKIPKDGRPCLFIDTLELFQDENTPFSHRIYLIKKLLYQLNLLRRQAPIFVSLITPRENHTQWNFMASLIRKSSTHTLKEGFMGKTLPTINQIVQQAEVILARFSRTGQPRERSAMELLLTSARKHIAAISEANHLLPFEAAQQAMLLEQQKEIIMLQAKLSRLEDHLGNQ